MQNGLPYIIKMVIDCPGRPPKKANHVFTLEFLPLASIKLGAISNSGNPVGNFFGTVFAYAIQFLQFLASIYDLNNLSPQIMPDGTTVSPSLAVSR